MLGTFAGEGGFGWLGFQFEGLRRCLSDGRWVFGVGGLFSVAKMAEGSADCVKHSRRYRLGRRLRRSFRGSGVFLGRSSCWRFRLDI